VRLQADMSYADDGGTAHRGRSLGQACAGQKGSNEKTASQGGEAATE
jgi:hypothetical protein